LITTASPGSGKTATLSGEAASKVGLKVEQIFDEVPKGKLILQQMIDAGFRPEISWIHVDQIGKTVERMVFRAKKIGRLFHSVTWLSPTLNCRKRCARSWITLATKFR
jgi:hypothetical protein